MPAPVRFARLVPARYFGTGTKGALPCPYGHAIDANARLMRGDGVFQCQHVAPGTRTPCRAEVWVTAGVTMADGTPALYVAHVLPAELAHFERTRATLAQVLAYLALTPLGAPPPDDARQEAA